MLQLIHPDHGVRNAAITLAASVESQALMLPIPAPLDNHRFYLLYYNKAIKSVHDTLSSVTSATDDRLVSCLVATTLFVVIELSYDARESAFLHIQSGLRIARTYVSSLPKKRQKLRHHHIQNLCAIFERLNIIAAMFPGYGRSKYNFVRSPDVFGGRYMMEGPLFFSTLNDAKEFLYALMNSAIELHLRCHRDTPFRSNQIGDKDKARSSLLLFHTSSFLAALDHYLSINRSTMRETGLYLSSLFNIHAKLLCIRLSVCQLGDYRGMAYDAFNAQFSEIITVLRDMNNEFKSFTHMDYLSHLPDVHALFFIGVLCRDPSLRRQALKMLCEKSPKQNLWCGVVQAAVLNRIIEIEEEGLDEVRECGDVVEVKRIRDPHMEVDYQNKLVSFRYWCFDDREEIVQKEELLCW